MKSGTTRKSRTSGETRSSIQRTQITGHEPWLLIQVKSWMLEAAVKTAPPYISGFRSRSDMPSDRTKGRRPDWATSLEALCFLNKIFGDSGMFITETFWHKILSCTCADLGLWSSVAGLWAWRDGFRSRIGPKPHTHSFARP